MLSKCQGRRKVEWRVGSRHFHPPGLAASQFRCLPEAPTCRAYRGVGCGTVRSGNGSIFRVEILMSVQTEHFGVSSECEETAVLLQISVSLAWHVAYISVGASWKWKQFASCFVSSASLVTTGSLSEGQQWNLAMPQLVWRFPNHSPNPCPPDSSAVTVQVSLLHRGNGRKPRTVPIGPPHTLHGLALHWKSSAVRGR